MNTLTLDELLRDVTQNTPYNKSLRVLVIACDQVRTFTSDQGDQRQYLYAAVADSTRAAKVTVYDSTKFSRFQEGKSILIRNFIKKPDGIVVSTNSRLFPTQDVPVPHQIRTQGVNIIRPPDAPHQPLQQALASPVTSRVSITGKIIQEEDVHEVTVRNDRVKVKSIYLKDSTSPKAKVSLWRELTTNEARTGDFVSITNVIVNHFKNETSFNTTYQTTIQTVDAPDEVKDVICVGASVENSTVSFLLDNDTEIHTQLDVVQAILPEVDNIEEHIMSLCDPVLNMRCTFRGTDLVNVAFI